MKLKAISFLFLISILLASCSQRQTKPSFDCSRFQIGKAIHFRDSLKEDASYHDYVQFFAKQLNIPDINSSEKDTTLRIWFWQPGDTGFVLDIEKNGVEGFGHLLGFGRSDRRPNYPIAITRCSSIRPPIHGWEKLLDTLRFYDIGSIPDGKPNDQLFFDLTGGGRIYIEYQQGFQFRFFSYLEPGYYQFVDSNAAKLHHFLVYLQNEFSLRVYQDITFMAQTPIRTEKAISQAEYQNIRNNRFIDSGERIVQLYGDFTSYTAILTNKRIGDYFPRSINLGDSLYEFVPIPFVRQVNLNLCSRGYDDTFRVTRRDGSSFDLRLGGDRQQLMNFFDSTDLVLRRARKPR
ncbi:MAG TPA: hypothetical protein VFE32_14900 [Puia sp.]|jgi:hypothetical protein|nr:hypothetical protein [Puia sp.]